MASPCRVYVGYDTTAGIPAVIEEVAGGSVYYVREPNGDLIARVEGTVIQYYHFDQLGSTRLITDTSGAVTDQYSYDAWGNITAQSGSTEQPYRYVGKLGYYTHHQDANLPLLQLGVRFYDPALGRFTQVDPAEDWVNLYAYAHDNPVTYTDPTGLQIDHLVEWPHICHLMGECGAAHREINMCCGNTPGCRHDFVPVGAGRRSRRFGIVSNGQHADCFEPDQKWVSEWIARNGVRGLTDHPGGSGEAKIMCVVTETGLYCAPCSSPGYGGYTRHWERPRRFRF